MDALSIRSEPAASKSIRIKELLKSFLQVSISSFLYNLNWKYYFMNNIAPL